MSNTLTPKELADFRWKAQQQFPNFGSRQAKKLMAYLDEVIAQRNVLARRLMEDNTSLEYGHEFPEGFIPRFAPETDSHAVTFWLEWAEAEARKKDGA